MVCWSRPWEAKGQQRHDAPAFAHRPISLLAPLEPSRIGAPGPKLEPAVRRALPERGDEPRHRDTTAVQVVASKEPDAALGEYGRLLSPVRRLVGSKNCYPRSGGPGLVWSPRTLNGQPDVSFGTAGVVSLTNLIPTDLALGLCLEPGLTL